MNKLRLCKISPNLIDLGFMTERKDVVYIFMGEFEHAPGHCMLMNWDTGEVTYMHDIDNYIFLDSHPDDVTFAIREDNNFSEMNVNIDNLVELAKSKMMKE